MNIVRLNNFIVLSSEQLTSIFSSNFIIEFIKLACSLIIKSGLYDILLNIVIELSNEPDAILPSSNKHKQLNIFLSIVVFF